MPTGADVAARIVVHARSFREHVAYDCLAHHRAAIDFSAHARHLADVTDAQIDAMAASWPDELEAGTMPAEAHEVG
jgi:hypothetical protein